MELMDKVAIITGSGRGIGFGIAQVFAREGAAVVINDRNQDDAKKESHRSCYVRSYIVGPSPRPWQDRQVLQACRSYQRY